MGQTREELPTILCVASFFKGNEFIRECRRQGAGVILLTRERMSEEPWARESLDDLLAVPGRGEESDYLEAATHAARRRRVTRVVALEEHDVLTAARVREWLCLPGLGSTAACRFHDKLAMRARAREAGVPQPDFVRLLNGEGVAEFLRGVPPPWMLKPRVGASAMGVKRMYAADEVWRAAEELDRRERSAERAPSHLLERYVPGAVYHVDTLVAAGRVVFANVSRYGAPPFDVTRGGVSTSHTVRRGSADERRLLALNKKVLTGFGFEGGTTHAEFIKGEDGQFYFLEVAARVGGAHTVEMVEAATGVNLWREWARIELAGEGRPYEPPKARADYGGIAITLAREEWPDTSSYDDREIFYRVRKSWHVGLVVRAEECERVTGLLDGYVRRFSEEFAATAPPEERPDQHF
jgi:biotin carboxylase